MGREESRIVFLSIQIHMQLQGGNPIGIVQLLYSSQENAAACPISVVIMHFALQMEVQEIGLCEKEDVIAIRPLWSLDSHHLIKPRDTEL
jgi:hypothetical protein